MGRVNGARFEKAGNQVTLLGSKDEVGILGDVVVLAVPYASVASILETNRVALEGKVIVDITNPVDFSTMDGLFVPSDSSASALIAKALVVKAFNTNFASTLAIRGQIAWTGGFSLTK